MVQPLELLATRRTLRAVWHSVRGALFLPVWVLAVPFAIFTDWVLLPLLTSLPAYKRDTYDGFEVRFHNPNEALAIMDAIDLVRSVYPRMHERARRDARLIFVGPTTLHRPRAKAVHVEIGGGDKKVWWIAGSLVHAAVYNSLRGNKLRRSRIATRYEARFYRRYFRLHRPLETWDKIDRHFNRWTERQLVRQQRAHNNRARHTLRMLKKAFRGGERIPQGSDVPRS